MYAPAQTPDLSAVLIHALLRALFFRFARHFLLLDDGYSFISPDREDLLLRLTRYRTAANELRVRASAATSSVSHHQLYALAALFEKLAVQSEKLAETYGSLTALTGGRDPRSL